MGKKTFLTVYQSDKVVVTKRQIVNKELIQITIGCVTTRKIKHREVDRE